MSAPRPCLVPGCGAYAGRLPHHKGKCKEHALEAERTRQAQHPAYAGYRSPRWFRLRSAILRSEPWCRACRALQRLTLATDIDHIEPHRGDLRKFWDTRNLQPLCKACHSRKTKDGA